ncbi:MAG: transposase family protein [Tannerella sp.]|jgi:hypothetical protein|nr:transposase family protein [Tannerella sp.]
MDVFSTCKSQPPAVFLRLTGMNPGTFQIILLKFKKEIEIYVSEHRARNKGRKCSLSPENQLLLCILYLRDYTTFVKLGLQFGISESYAQKRYVFTKKMLLRCLELPDEQSLKTSLETNLIAVDVTEHAIERPISNQRDYYSGKKNFIR